MEALVVSLISCLLVGIFHVPLVAVEGSYQVRISCGSSIDSTAPNGFLWSKGWSYSAGSSANLFVIDYSGTQLKSVCYFQLSDGEENCYNVIVPIEHYLIKYGMRELLFAVA